MKPTNQPTPPRGALSKLKSATEKEVHHDSETRGQQEQINTFVTVKFVIHKLMSFSKVFFSDLNTWISQHCCYDLNHL